MNGNDKRKKLKSISYVILKAKEKLNSNDDQKERKYLRCDKKKNR
jgi:hypothetical protein